MSTELFTRLAKGQVQTEGEDVHGMVMGRPVHGRLAALAIAAVIGTGIGHGTISPVDAAIAAKAAHVDVVEPPVYVARDPNAHYTAKYNYDLAKNENIGGGPSSLNNNAGPS